MAVAAAAGKLLLRRINTTDVQLPRLVHTPSPCRAMSAAAPSTDATSKAAELRGELQRKKEELYSLLDLVERGEHCEGVRLSWWDRVERHRNLKLLQRLSVQIHPKPSDPQWRWHRGWHVFNSAAFCAVSGLAGLAVGDLQLGPDRMKEKGGQDDDEEEQFDALAWMKHIEGDGERVNQLVSDVYGRPLAKAG